MRLWISVANQCSGHLRAILSKLPLSKRQKVSTCPGHEPDSLVCVSFPIRRLPQDHRSASAGASSPQTAHVGAVVLIR